MGSRSLTLRLLAPTISVAVFWLGFQNGWLAILGYHAQILFWARRDRSRPWLRLAAGRSVCLAAPMLAVGPLLYVLLPFMARTDLSAWLARYHLTGPSLLLLIPYFGIVHPVIEQVHWASLRERTPLSHAFFAGYHVLVLHSLLRLPWLILCAAALLAASVGWMHLARRTGSLALPVASHVAADLGLIVAAWSLVGGLAR